MSDRRVLSLLGRWHQWRRAWPMERGYARVVFLAGDDDEDELERLTMQAVEEEIQRLEPLEQLALQHVARAECMGVEVVMNPRLGNDEKRADIVERALSAVARRLLHAGLM